MHCPGGGDGAGRSKVDKGRGRGCEKGKKAGGGSVPPPVNLMSFLAAALGPFGGVAAGPMESGGLGVALPCASAKRSRLLPEVFDDCSYVGCRLSLRDWAIRELNETVIALNFP